MEEDFKHLEAYRGQIIFQDCIFPLELCPIGCCSHLLHINHNSCYCSAFYEAKGSFNCLFIPFLNVGAPGDLGPSLVNSTQIVYKIDAVVRWGFDNLSRQMWRGMEATGAKDWRAVAGPGGKVAIKGGGGLLDEEVQW